MTKRQTPPTRNSNACVVVVKPFGPHHCPRCTGSEKAPNTSARGASMVRTKTIERASISPLVSFLAATPLLLALQLLQIHIEPIEALFPEFAIAPQPDVDVLERRALDAARPPLRFAAARDQARTLQHLQMLRHRRQAHVKRLGQLGDGCLAQRQTREDRTPGRIGERGEGGAETVSRHAVLNRVII